MTLCYHVIPSSDRRWFGNTRVIESKKLDAFREEMNNAVKDPYTVVMRSNKLPMGLLNDPVRYVV